MIVVRSLLFHIGFWVLTISMGTLALPVLFSQKATRFAAHLWVCGSLVLLRLCCGLRVEVRGREHIPARPCIFASKHQSTLDTLVLWRLLGGPAFILKRELLFIPFFGWYLARTRPIPIRRGAGAKALSDIAAASRQRHESGRHIMIFPEGTRTKPGATVHYKTAGLSTLYGTLDCEIVPVALNCGVFWPKLTFVKKPGVAVVECLAPVPAGLAREVMLTQVQERIEAASKALL